MQLIGIFFQCASHSGDVLCIPSLGVQVNLKISRCLSVMRGSSCVIPPGVFSFLNCYLPRIAFLVMEHTFPSLFVGEIEAGAASWVPCMHRLCCCVPLVEQESLE